MSITQDLGQGQVGVGLSESRNTRGQTTIQMESSIFGLRMNLKWIALAIDLLLIWQLINHVQVLGQRAWTRLGLAHGIDTCLLKSTITRVQASGLAIGRLLTLTQQPLGLINTGLSTGEGQRPSSHDNMTLMTDQVSRRSDDETGDRSDAAIDHGHHRTTGRNTLSIDTHF